MRHNPVPTRRLFSRMFSRGRPRAGSLAETFAEDVVAEIVDELKHEAAPLVQRATGRGRRRRRGRILALVLLGLAVCGGLCYLLWRRRDEEPADRIEEPDRPNVAPAGSPAPAAPVAGPSDPGGLEQDAATRTAARPLNATAERELTGARGGVRYREQRDLGAHDAAPALPARTARAPFAAGKDQLPPGSRPSLPR